MDKFVDNVSQRTDSPITDITAHSTESDSDDNSEPQLKKPNKVGATVKPPTRKYVDTYLKYGFIASGDKPQCVMCLEVLANASMKPSKLLRHQRTKHKETIGKPLEFFQRKSSGVQKQSGAFRKFTAVNSDGLKASYQVALRIAKSKKPHTLAEQVILPCAVDMVRAVLGEDSAKKIRTIPLSDNTISRRIADMSTDVKEQLIDMIKTRQKFALQVDESTDISDCAVLIVYVRFVNTTDSVLQEEFLFSEGRLSGVVQRIKNVAPSAVAYYCFIHREALAAP